MSTVHICLKDILGVAVKCEAIFYPGDTPFQNGTAMALSGRCSVWLDAGGNGSVKLLAGSYAVRFSGLAGNTDTLYILVPDDEATYELPALITRGSWALPMRDFMQAARNLADLTDPAAAFAAIKQPASAAATGVVALASQVEVDAGADAAKAITPATLAGASALVSIHTALAQKAEVSALPKTVTVADKTALFALTSASVNAGDRVVVTTGESGATEYYEVINTAKLGSYAGYGALRDGPVSFDGGKVQSSGQGNVQFYTPYTEPRMRLSCSDLMDDYGLYCGTITFDGDEGLGLTQIYGSAFGMLGLVTDTLNLKVKHMDVMGCMYYDLVDDLYPRTKLGMDKWYIESFDRQICSFEVDGLHLTNSAGFFGAYPLMSQPAAIEDASDLDSALTAVNGLLAMARAYGMIAS